MLKVGSINKLKVIRETDIGFMLDGKTTEVFLHKNESNFLSLKSGDLVDAFLYYDNEGRLAATLKKPLLVKGEKQMLTVVGVVRNLGVFLDMGINKDVLLSKDDLPSDFELWPSESDKVFATIIEKGNRLVAKLVKVTELKESKTLVIGDEKSFYVASISDEGINLYNEDKEIVFVHKTLIRKKYRLGENISVKIINETDKGYYGSTVEQKEILRYDDAEIILNALIKHGKIPLTAKSSADDVYKYFKMSRKAFKRALGLLYKQNKVKFTDTETIFIGDNNE